VHVQHRDHRGGRGEVELDVVLGFDEHGGGPFRKTSSGGAAETACGRSLICN
jgi:hypothetical protein